MSKLHVTQIGGYLTTKLSGSIYLDDYAGHADKAQVDKAFLTRALVALAISTLAEVNPAGLTDNITDGTDDGGIDGIYFDSNDQILYLVQAKWHADGNGSIELGDALKFLDGVSKVLNNELDTFSKRVQSREGDIQSALYDANAKFVLVIAHTGQHELADPLRANLLHRLRGSEGIGGVVVLLGEAVGSPSAA